jgi:hypothetical protein
MNDTTKEKIKNLLKRAKETGDHELILLASDLIDLNTGNNDQAPVEKTKTTPKLKIMHSEEFVMNSEKKNKLAQPLEVKQRVNTFVDDQQEHKDIETPTVKLTERRRKPFEKVEQKCSRCGTVVMIHPKHAREFFKCDSCLRR